MMAAQYKKRWVFKDLFLCCKAQFYLISNQLDFFQSRAHGDAECTDVMAYMLAQKGKAAANETTYNSDDPPEAHNNPSIHSRFTTYAETRRQIHGPEWDPILAPFDEETVMRIGGGKKYDHYYMGDNLLDAESTPTLATVKAKDTGNAPPIRPRPSAALAEMERLKVISDLLIITKFLHMLTLRCNIGMNNCRRP
jgi:hypothetical protein